jgi:hypothetical protein
MNEVGTIATSKSSITGVSLVPCAHGCAARLASLRALNIRAEVVVWDAHGWYNTFVGSVEMLWVLRSLDLEMPGEAIFYAL